MRPSRPVLRYPGGKFRIAKWIISHFPVHRLYVEPFGGAGSVLMAKPRSQGEIYNDLDSDIVNVFRLLRDPQAAKELEHQLRLTPMSYEEYKIAYEHSDDPMEEARRLIFRSFASIASDGVQRSNGGFRGLKNGDTSVTSAQQWESYPNAISSFTSRLSGVLIENRPALQLLEMYGREDTLFYIDPPYLFSTRTNRTVDYKHEITEEEHIELAKAIRKSKSKFVISGYRSDLYDDLYHGFKTALKTAEVGGSNHARIECLWLSPNVQTTLW